MEPRLYKEFADWWPLLSAPKEYEEEAAAYSSLLRSACVKPPRTILELGSGGGNNAYFMKREFELTLCDRSPAMLAVSRKLNPDCAHVEGDMRSVRLKRKFDAVFIHDAIAYMTTTQDLLRAMETAYAHCRKGGAALFVPDYTKETFRSATSHGGHDRRKRSLRYLQWDHDPNPGDTQYKVELVYLLREGDRPLRVEQDTHTCGLFSRTTWMRLLKKAGFTPDTATLESDEFEAGYYRVFIGRKL